MSSTELYAVKSNGDVEFYDEVNNSWAGGMHVWQHLNKKYALDGNMFNGFGPLFKNVKKGMYQHHDEVILLSTADYVLVKKENFKKLIDSFLEYAIKTTGSNYLEQIKIIQEMQEDDSIVGVGWCQTSVDNDMWDYDYDEETDETIPYNINKGNEHWFLFDELNSKED